MPRPTELEPIVTTPKPTPTRVLREHAGVLAAAALLVLGAAALLLLVRGGGDEREPTPGLRAEAAVPAAEFRASVGVNVHLSYGDTAYGDFDAVRRALADLGVRHVRDGACAGCTETNDKILALSRDGVRFTLIAGSPRNETGTLAENLGSIRGALRPAVEAVEGPNEYDNSGDPDWAAALRDYQRALFDRVRGDDALRALPVIGPSFVQEDSRGRAGDMSAWMTFGNLHSYAGGAPPSDGLGDERSLAGAVSADRPVVATETGYHDALAATTGQPPVDEATAAAYIPRLYLDYFHAGIRRAFVYELVDQRADPGRTDPERHFGLLRSDWSPKPAYTALRGLLAAVGDGAPDGRATLRYGLRDAGDTRKLLLASGDGRMSLVLWRPEPVWDQTARVADAPAPRTVTVRFGQPVRSAAIVQRGRTLAEHSDPTQVRVEVAGDPVVVRVTPEGDDG